VLSFFTGFSGQASLVYLAYYTLLFYIDVKAQPDAESKLKISLVGGDENSNVDDPYQQAVREVNLLYLVSAVLRVLNSLQWMAVWLPHRNPRTGDFWKLYDWVQIPEFFNFLEAVLYTATACMYNWQVTTGPERYLDSSTALNKRLELAAACTQMCAALGWVWVWWVTHPRGPGRGFTLDDPELISLALIFSPSVIHMVYYVRVLSDPSSLLLGATSQLYLRANLLFFIGAFFYVAVSLRDEGVFESFGVFGFLWGCLSSSKGGRAGAGIKKTPLTSNCPPPPPTHPTHPNPLVATSTGSAPPPPPSSLPVHGEGTPIANIANPLHRKE